MDSQESRRGGPRARVFTTYLTGTREQLMEKLGEYEVSASWYAGQLELGREGMEHIQLSFGYANPRSLNALQAKLPDGANIQIARDPAASIKYCTDEKKRIENHLFTFGEVPAFNKNQNLSETLNEAVKFDTFNEAMEHIRKTDFATYVMSYKKLFTFFENYYATGDLSKFKPEDFVSPLRKLPVNKTLVFIGPTAFGKTQFALAHFLHPLRITCKQDWNRFREGVTDGIVLDDIHFNDWKPNTLLHTVDVENASTQDVKYGAVRIPAGIPRIICINSESELWPANIEPEKKEAIQRRLELYHVLTPLFDNRRT